MLRNHITKRTFTSFWSQIFRDEKIKIKQAITGKHGNLPWMRSREVDLLQELLLALKPKKCLEWGSGNSSIYFTKLFTHDFSWISIEHNKEWFETIKNQIKNPKLTIHYVGADTDYEYEENNDGSYKDFESYINFPNQKGPFDFIFIDGRARVECVKKAITLLSDNGVICLHDANRLEYKEYVSTIPSTFIFNDWRKKSGGFWLMSKSPELIQKCIDTQHYSDIFSIYTIVGRRIKV